MITEIGVATTLVAGYNLYKYRNYYKENKIFRDTIKVKDKEFYIIATQLTDYGTEFIISLKNKEFKELEGFRDLLKNNFKGDIEIEQNDNGTATVRVIKKEINEKFNPVEIKPYEVYIGLDNHFEPIIVNLNQYPHILISGATGSGKTQELKLILSNLINSNSERDINIYFSNISESNDFKNFIRCKQVKAYVEKIDESLKMFEYINHMYSKRLDIFKKNNVADIKEYNAKFPNKRMAYDYLVLDEFADYFPSNKLEEGYETKIKCYNILKHLVRKGRKAGIFLIIALQRSDTTVLDPSLKANLCTKISFTQTNSASSLVICDTTELVGLQPRIFMTTYGSNKVWSKSLYIDDCMIKKCVKESISNHRLNTFLEPIREQKQYNKVVELKNKKSKKVVKRKKDEVAVEKVSRVKNIEVTEIKQGRNV
ncbi:hypothetical protein GCM10008908_09470 [Clostridium subterminale]|uniref:FtsK domain-containing protein n=1 Tax=Clostridium subterminale TaxID=1550 RepID=A0ABP3VSZ9_CLOSU